MFYVLMGFVALVLVGGLLVLLARNAERRAREPRQGRAFGAHRGAVEAGASDSGPYAGSGFDGGSGGCDSGGGDGGGGGCD